MARCILRRRLSARAIAVAGLWAALRAAAGQSAPSVAPANPMLAEIPVVEAAALHAQTLEEAPAKVTVITAENIRAYGYRTLADALASVPGFYATNDRIYHYFGVRGFLVSGDYNTRFLVMLNGHPLTDNVYDSNGYFGQDFGLDMDLVSRIEVICGPTSALYGSNGILANINIITKSPVDLPRLRVSTETGSFGQKKAIVTSSTALGHGANLLVSASGLYNGGETLSFPGLAPGPLSGLDRERGYHTFASLSWKNWTFSSLFGSRDKIVPIPWGDGALLFDRGNQVRDSRNFVSAAWTHSFQDGSKFRWQLYYDQYRYDDRFIYPGDSDEAARKDVRSLARADWLGTEAMYQFTAGQSDITVGGQIEADIRKLQQDRVVSPSLVYLPAIDTPEQRQAAFVQEEWHLAPEWSLSAGLRADRSSRYGSSLSPRVALVWQATPRTTYKAVWGMPFRNPSAFEAFYTDGGAAFLANPALRAERAHTYELSAERRFRGNMSIAVSGYRYHIRDLIEATYLDGDLCQYRNVGHARSTGVELEASRKTAALELTASYAYQWIASSGGRVQEVNSPAGIVKARAAAPLAGRRLTLSSAVQYMSRRQTYALDYLRPALLTDVTLSTNRLHPDFDIQAGIRNLAGWRYSDPVGLSLDRMPAPGREFFVKLIWRTRE